MHLGMSRPDYQFVAYIDEAGDPGVKAAGASAASEWFLVSAVVVSADRDRDVVDWVRDMREAVRTQQRHPIHYRKLSPTNRQRVCRMLSTKSVRIFTIASHKTNMRGRQNPRMGKPMGRGEFYNWMLRLLLERVTIWCAHRAKVDGIGGAVLKPIFSERGGHDYSHLQSYLRLLQMQAENGGAVLRARQIVPGVIDHTLIEIRPHADLAGLQLADIAASAFFQAVNVAEPADLMPARSLKARTAKDVGKREAAEFGLLRLPFPQHGDIPVESRPIFEDFGYGFPANA